MAWTRGPRAGEKKTKNGKCAAIVSPKGDRFTWAVTCRRKWLGYDGYGSHGTVIDVVEQTGGGRKGLTEAAAKRTAIARLKVWAKKRAAKK